MTGTQFKYWAFISYSHQDAAWAAWLHKALEGYVVPRRLIGSTTPIGPAPRRFVPVFRDRDELPSSSHLNEAINEALQRSRVMIVIASPNAAASHWVNEEIRQFKALGRAQQVLALIVDGDPSAAARGQAGRDCFPPALCHEIDADGRVSARPTEPVAADLRAAQGTRQEALLKLIAGMLGIGYDELRQRERSKRLWQRLRWLGGTAVLSAAALSVWSAEQREQAARDHEALLGRLFDAGRLETLAGHPSRSATLLSAAYSGGLDTPALRLLLRQATTALDAQTTVRSHHADDAPGILAWLPDGKRFVTVWRNAKLWDAATGRELLTLGNGNFTAIFGIAISSDARRVLVSGRDDFSDQPPTVELYDADSGRTLLQQVGHATSSEYGDAFRSFSPDGRQLVLIDADGAVTLHATDTGATIRRLPVTATTSASFTPDGQRLVVADADGRISIWNARLGTRLMSFESRLGGAVRAFMAPDGRIFASSAKGKVHIHDAKSGMLLDALGGHTSEIRQFELSDDGGRLLTNAVDGAKVWDLASGDQLLQISCKCTVATTYDLDARGQRLLARVDPLRVGIWDVDRGSLRGTLEAHSSEVNGMQFSPDGRQILTGAIDGDAVVWNADAFPARPAMLLAHDPPLAHDADAETYSGRYSPDGRQLVTVGTDATARLWNARDGQLLHVLRGHEKTIYHAAFSPDGRLLATASDDLTARLWDVETGRERFVLGGHNRFVRRVVFSPDGSRLLSVAGTEPRVWDTASGRLVAVLRGHEEPAVEGLFSRDGQRVLTTGVDGVPRIFETETGRLLQALKGHRGVVAFAQFVADDHRVITAGLDSTLRVWDADSGEEVARISEPLAGAGGLRYGSLSHDGRLALLSAMTGELLLWDWRLGTTRRFVGHTIASYWSEFSADDRLAVSASNDGSSRIWDIASGTELAVMSLSSRNKRMWSASFDPGAERVLTTGYSSPPTAEIWDFPREQRRADEIATLLRCKSPWMLEGEKLVAHRPEPEACAALPAPPASAAPP